MSINHLILSELGMEREVMVKEKKFNFSVVNPPSKDLKL